MDSVLPFKYVAALAEIALIYAVLTKTPDKLETRPVLAII